MVLVGRLPLFSCLSPAFHFIFPSLLQSSFVCIYCFNYVPPPPPLPRRYGVTSRKAKITKLDVQRLPNPPRSDMTVCCFKHLCVLAGGRVSQEERATNSCVFCCHSRSLAWPRCCSSRAADVCGRGGGGGVIGRDLSKFAEARSSPDASDPELFRKRSVTFSARPEESVGVGGVCVRLWRGCREWVIPGQDRCTKEFVSQVRSYSVHELTEIYCRPVKHTHT